MIIADKHFTPKFTLRSMLIFEQVADKPFEIKTSTDMFIYFWSSLAANADNPSITFDEFLDWCDEHPETIVDLQKQMSEEQERKSILGGKKKEVTENL